MNARALVTFALSLSSLAAASWAAEPRAARLPICEPDQPCPPCPIELAARCPPIPTPTPRPRPTLPPPTDDPIIKSHLQQAVAPVLTLSQNPSFREIVYAGVAEQFDGDDNVLLSVVLDRALRAGVIDTSSPQWQQLQAKINDLQNVQGHAYQPQIYIPNFEDGGMTWRGAVTIAIVERDERQQDVPAYRIGADGSVTLLPHPIGEDYAEQNEVWVISVNERVDLDPVAFAQLRAFDATNAAARTEALSCNPTGLRNNKGLEYLKQFRIMNLRSVEHWTAGKIEPRVVIVGKGGAEISNKYFGKIKRKHLRDQKWYTTDSFITTWDRATWGDYLAFKWIESDGGPEITIDLKLSATILKLITASGGVSAKFNKKFDDMGAGVVGFDESTYIVYSTGILEWTECTMGGDGGTGDSNIARSAIVSAQSSYSGYSPARVNDGSRDTSLGGNYSWSNAHVYGPNGVIPQWFQLDFGVPRTFSRVDVYTTGSYPISAYDIQYWNASLGTWQHVLSVDGNTASYIRRDFGAVNSRLLRLWCRRGPSHQPQHVRLNEVEVY